MNSGKDRVSHLSRAVLLRALCSLPEAVLESALGPRQGLCAAEALELAAMSVRETDAGSSLASLK